MDASVIIPAYNCADTIGEQLDALAAQSYSGSFEIIISDNGSTDETSEIVHNYMDRFDALKIIDAHHKKGPAYARNRGVEESVANFILFCDADDKVSCDWVDEMVKALRKHHIVAPRMEHFEISDIRYAKIRQKWQRDGLLESRLEPPLSFAGGSGLGIRKELHKKIGGFDERFLASEDMDYCWRAQLAGGAELFFNSDALIHIRHRSTPYQWIRQAFLWGSYDSMIEKKYSQYGMILSEKDYMIKKYKKIIMKMNKITDREWRDRLVWRIFKDLGKLKGRILYRNVDFK